MKIHSLRIKDESQVPFNLQRKDNLYIKDKMAGPKMFFILLNNEHHNGLKIRVEDGPWSRKLN